MDLCHSGTGGVGGGQKELIYIFVLFSFLTSPKHIVGFAGFIQNLFSIKKWLENYFLQ